ncbi:MAG: FkbM family methyltransferase [Candidatus Aenigmatarchaeota archaeon]
MTRSGTDFSFIERRVRGRKDRYRLESIKRDWYKIMKEGQVIKDRKLFSMKIGEYRFWFRRGSAPSSIDTYLEVFKDNNHMKVPGFKGKGNKVVLDIGANEGFYTFGMKKSNPKLKIVAVEPVPATFELLKRNVLGNGLKDIVLVNKALTRRKGRITFEIVPEVSAVCGLDIAMQKRPWLDTKRIKKITVESTTLADLCKELKIGNIDILKLDVEGSELDILRGSADFLPHISKIVIEWHSEKLKEGCKSFLKKKGFRLVREESKMCGDLYFVNTRRTILL